MRAIFFVFVVVLLGSAAARAQTAAPPQPQTLDTVLVTGEQPGPGLWKVSKGDHVLWILGTLSPLPKHMTWRSKPAEDILVDSQELLADGYAKIDVGFFRTLTLLPSLLHARKNTDGARLQDILSPDLYARWLVLKRRYIGHDNGVERRRPMLAARELFHSAIAKSDLTNDNEVWDVLAKSAHKHHVRVVTPHVDIPIDDPKDLIKDFENSSRKLDIACLATTIERIETDMDAMRQRANAWSTGDLDTLRRLTHPDDIGACLAAVTNPPRLQKRVESAFAQINAAWIAAATSALAENRSTFAVVPLWQLTSSKGYLAQLRTAGFTVEEPQ